MSDTSDFASKNVVVTGGGGALGRAVVAGLVARGATVHVPAFNQKESDFLEGQFAAGVAVKAGVDLTDEKQVADYYSSLPGLWASVHIAGGFAMAPLNETSADDFMVQIKMNALSAFLCCREGAAKMQGAGGRLVNVAARPALEPRTGAGMAAYTASKAAVAALTQALAEELAGKGILVNAVAPSIIDTPANRSAMPDADYSAWPKPEEIAETIIHLASPAAAAARGGVVAVYGKA